MRIRFLPVAIAALAAQVYVGTCITAAHAKAEKPVLTFEEQIAFCKSKGWRCEWKQGDFRIEMNRGLDDIVVTDQINKRRPGYWALACRADKMDDSSSCALRRGFAQYPLPGSVNPNILLLWSTKYPGVRISLSHKPQAYPGSIHSIRVDTNPQHQVKESQVFSERVSDAIYKELLSGTQVNMRYYDWPYNIGRDGSADLGRFAEIMAIVDKLRLQTGMAQYARK